MIPVKENRAEPIQWRFIADLQEKKSTSANKSKSSTHSTTKKANMKTKDSSSDLPKQKPGKSNCPIHSNGKTNAKPKSSSSASHSDSSSTGIQSAVSGTLVPATIKTNAFQANKNHHSRSISCPVTKKPSDSKNRPLPKPCSSIGSTGSSPTNSVSSKTSSLGSSTVPSPNSSSSSLSGGGACKNTNNAPPPSSALLNRFYSRSLCNLASEQFLDLYTFGGSHTSSPHRQGAVRHPNSSSGQMNSGIPGLLYGRNRSFSELRFQEYHRVSPAPLSADISCLSPNNFTQAFAQPSLRPRYAQSGTAAGVFNTGGDCFAKQIPHSTSSVSTNSRSQIEQTLLIDLQPNESLGCSVVRGPPNMPGIFVQGVKPDSRAELVGMQTGDQIIALNGRSFLSNQFDFTQAVQMIKSSGTKRIRVRKQAGLALLYMGENKSMRGRCSPTTDESHLDSGIGSRGGSRNDRSSSDKDERDDLTLKLKNVSGLRISESSHSKQNRKYKSKNKSSTASSLSTCNGSVISSRMQSSSAMIADRSSMATSGSTTTNTTTSGRRSQLMIGFEKRMSSYENTLRSQREAMARASRFYSPSEHDYSVSEVDELELLDCLSINGPPVRRSLAGPVHRKLGGCQQRLCKASLNRGCKSFAACARLTTTCASVDHSAHMSCSGYGCESVLGCDCTERLDCDRRLHSRLDRLGSALDPTLDSAHMDCCGYSHRSSGAALLRHKLLGQNLSCSNLSMIGGSAAGSFYGSIPPADRMRLCGGGASLGSLNAAGLDGRLSESLLDLDLLSQSGVYEKVRLEQERLAFERRELENEQKRLKEQMEQLQREK